MTKLSGQDWNSRAAIAWVAAAGAATLVLMSGCSKLDTSGAGNLVGPSSATPQTVAAASTEMDPPSLDELRNRLGLDDAQSAKVAAALAAWKSTLAAGASSAPGTGDVRGGPGGRGRPGGRPPGAGRDSGACVTPPPPPHMAFLEQTSGALQTRQFVGESQVLDEHMQQHLAPGGPAGQRRGPGGPIGHLLGAFARATHLSEATMKQVGDAFRDEDIAVMNALAAYQRDASDGAALRDAAAGARDALVAALRGILTTDQIGTLQSMLADARRRGAECRLAKLADESAEHAAGLARMLQLTGEQKRQVENVLITRQPEIQTMLTGVRDGTLAYEDAVATGARIEKETRQAIRALLTPEQIERLDATRPLARGHVPVIWF